MDSEDSNTAQPGSSSGSSSKKNSSPAAEPQNQSNRNQLRSFDRLLPRYCDEKTNKKRKLEAAAKSEVELKKLVNNNAKKEYSKLRTLVPALTEREDLSKVEIIEETIRYIDALHHQLATRGLPNTAIEHQEAQEASTSIETNLDSKLIICFFI